MTANERETGVAAAKLLSPGWLAVRLQVPAATRFSVVPLTVQTDVVVYVIVTARPDVDVATSAGGTVPIVWLPGDTNVMVCPAM